tara:strand:- start:1082 stop:1243 length:162 start_codon:yes stop_codon:yes gene_type:complete
MKARKGLSVRQEKTMKRHSKHHTKKHMMFMRKAMLGGMSFTEAHKRAIKEVGK